MSEVKVTQSCLTLCDPMDCVVHGIFQARILEWVAYPFSRGSSQHRDWGQVSHIAGGFFTSWAFTRGEGDVNFQRCYKQSISKKKKLLLKRTNENSEVEKYNNWDEKHSRGAHSRFELTEKLTSDTDYAIQRTERKKNWRELNRTSEKHRSPLNTPTYV